MRGDRCHHCYSIGHNVSSCRWIHPQQQKDKDDRGKQIVVAEKAPSTTTRQHTDEGASTSANGSTWTWVPVPITSTVTTSQRVLVTSAPSPLAPPSKDIPTPIISSSHIGPVVTSTSAVVTSHMTVSMPKMSLSSTSFSFPLHNIFDSISSEELPLATPVFEIFSPHDEAHSERVEQSHPTSREELENPVVDDVTATFSDDVEHNHSRPPELVESPNGDHEHVPHSSTVEHDDVHEVSMESQQVQIENLVEHVDVHSVPNQSPMAACSIDNFVVSHEAFVISLEGTEEIVQEDVNINVSHNQDEHVAAEIQQQEVYLSKNIQHGLDLWERVRQHDERSALEDFTPVLTRKQKQKQKLQQVLQKQPTETCARGDPSTTAQ